MATTWTDMLKRGASILWVVKIEGIPTLFAERSVGRSDSSNDVSMPSGITSVSPALLIGDSDGVSIELDRKEGISRGDAWDITLAWNALEDDGILDDIFARPSAESSLKEVPDTGSDSILEHDETTIKVTDNSVFSASQTVWLGKEAITIGAIDGDGVSLTGCTRGVAGYAYQFDSQSFGNYRQVTNRPALWRGRFVELHAHLVSLEGRMIDTTWLTGTYHRTMWRGYLDSPPIPDQHGMRLRALPLARLAANDLGFSVHAELQNALPYAGDYDDDKQPLYGMMINASGAQTVFFEFTYTDSGGTVYTATTTQPDPQLADGFYPLAEWVSALNTGLATYAAANAWLSHFEVQIASTFHPEGAVEVRAITSGSYGLSEIAALPCAGVYWLKQKAVTQKPSAVTSKHVQMEIMVDPPPGAWVPVKEVSGKGIEDFSVPASGLGIITAGGTKEIVRWTERDTTLVATYGVVMLKMVDRQINNTPRAPFSEGGKLSVLSGHAGTAADIIRTVCESSGTGARGSYDTLPLGQGLGIPEAWLALATMTAWQVDSYPMLAVSEGRSSLGDMVGGWLALSGRCLTQTVNSLTGECQLAVVSTQPLADAGGQTITTADVLLESVGAPQVVDAPNEIEIDPSGLDKEPSITIRDVPRIQSEGPRGWKLKVPSIGHDIAQQYGQVLIAIGEGQSVIELTLGPWVDIQPGTPVSLTVAHPIMFDWTNGTRAAATVHARCVGWRMDLASGKQRVTLLVNGGAADTSYLAPTVSVTNVGSSGGLAVLTVEAYGTTWFVNGEKIVIYTPGDEDDPAQGTATIHSLDAAANTITLTAGSVTGVVLSTSNVVTHAPWGDASTAQKAFMYTNTTKTWGI